MNKATVTMIALVAGVAAIVVPIAVALQLAGQESLEIEKVQALTIAREVLRRTDEVGDQADRAAARLAALQSPEPCSDANIAEMRAIDIGSSYLQMVGYVGACKRFCVSIHAIISGRRYAHRIL